MKLLHQDASVEAREFLRVWVFGIWFLIFLFDPIADLSELPRFMFRPVGFIIRFWPASIQDWLISAPFLWGLKLLSLSALLGVLLRKFLKTSSVLACLLITIHQSIVRSYGHINHAELGLIYTTYLLTLFYIADWMSKTNAKDAEEPPAENLNSLPFIGALTLICFTYTFIGLHRFFGGGWELFRSNSLAIWIVEGSNKARSIHYHLDHLIINYPIMATMLKWSFPVITVCEIFAPLCLVSKRFRQAFLTVIIPFHISVWLFMRIVFWENMLLYILFFDITHWFNPQMGRVKRAIYFITNMNSVEQVN